MCEEVGLDIGKTIGAVQAESDLKDDLKGKVLSVLIEIDITQPITRGRIIKMNGSSYWVPLSNENLPRLCFQCWMISHDYQLCVNGGSKLNINM